MCRKDCLFASRQVADAVRFPTLHPLCADGELSICTACADVARQSVVCNANPDERSLLDAIVNDSGESEFAVQRWRSVVEASMDASILLSRVTAASGWAKSTFARLSLMAIVAALADGATGMLDADASSAVSFIVNMILLCSSALSSGQKSAFTKKVGATLTSGSPGARPALALTSAASPLATPSPASSISSTSTPPPPVSTRSVAKSCWRTCGSSAPAQPRSAVWIAAFWGATPRTLTTSRLSTPRSSQRFPSSSAA